MLFFIYLQAIAEALGSGSGGTGSATGDGFAFGGDHNSLQKGKATDYILFRGIYITCIVLFLA